MWAAGGAPAAASGAVVCIVNCVRTCKYTSSLHIIIYDA